jgi:hypothetical protein
MTGGTYSKAPRQRPVTGRQPVARRLLCQSLANDVGNRDMPLIGNRLEGVEYLVWRGNRGASHNRMIASSKTQ